MPIPRCDPNYFRSKFESELGTNQSTHLIGLLMGAPNHNWVNTVILRRSHKKSALTDCVIYVKFRRPLRITNENHRTGYIAGLMRLTELFARSPRCGDPHMGMLMTHEHS
jgi:hypothetical protein